MSPTSTVSDNEIFKLKSLDFEIDNVLRQIECDSASTDIVSEISQRVLDFNGQ